LEFPPTSFGGLARCNGRAFFRIYDSSFTKNDGEQAATPPSSFGGLAQCHSCALYRSLKLSCQQIHQANIITNFLEKAMFRDWLSFISSKTASFNSKKYTRIITVFYQSFKNTISSE